MLTGYSDFDKEWFLFFARRKVEEEWGQGRVKLGEVQSYPELCAGLNLAAASLESL